MPRFTRFYSRRIAQMPHRNGRGTASRLSARVLEAMDTIERLLGDGARARAEAAAR